MLAEVELREKERTLVVPFLINSWRSSGQNPASPPDGDSNGRVNISNSDTADPTAPHTTFPNSNLDGQPSGQLSSEPIRQPSGYPSTQPSGISIGIGELKTGVLCWNPFTEQYIEQTRLSSLTIIHHLERFASAGDWCSGLLADLYNNTTATTVSTQSSKHRVHGHSDSNESRFPPWILLDINTLDITDPIGFEEFFPFQSTYYV